MISCKQGGVAADAAPEIFRVTPEMLETKAANLDDPSAGLDDNDTELDANELGIDAWIELKLLDAMLLLYLWHSECK